MKRRGPRESVQTEFCGRLFSNHRSRWCHPRECRWNHHWLDHRRFNRGDIRVWKRLLRCLHCSSIVCDTTIQIMRT